MLQCVVALRDTGFQDGKVLETNTYALGRLRPEVCIEKRYKRFQVTAIWKMCAVRGNCI